MNRMRQDHLSRPLFPHNHTSEYLMHKFWSRKPHNIVAAYIADFSKPGEVVLDPFGGSGVTLNEALRLGRRAISFDANPIATFITRNTITIVDPSEFDRLARSVYAQVAPSIEGMYSAPCPSCGKASTMTHVLWHDVITCRCGSILDLPTNSRDRDGMIKCHACGTHKPSDVQRASIPYKVHYSCEACGSSTRAATPGEVESQTMLAASTAYQHAIEDLPSLSIPLAYPNGASFIQLRHDLRTDPRLRNLFTARNLIAIHAFWKAIMRIPAEIEAQRTQKDMLLFLFSSMLPQASKMVWVIKKRENKQLAKYEVGSWTHHFFWNPTEFFEVNVLNGYGERLSKFLKGLRSRGNWTSGGQHWCKVCLDDPGTWWLSRKTVVAPGWQILDEIKPVVADIAVSAADFFSSGDRTALVETCRVQQLTGIPDASVDYIFTDPPYGDSIQYAELAAFFLAWIKPRDMVNWLRDAYEQEITINKGQGKDFGAYKGMLQLAFKECHRVLKPGHYVTLTFHDTDARVRSVLYEAMQDAGFTFQDTVYQPPPRPSEKSLLHEKGSPTGDYMITFKKPDVEKSEPLLKVTDEETVLKVAIDAIFARRGEPVPFNFLLSLLDLQLAEMGYLPPDMRQPLERFLHANQGYSRTEKRGWFFTDVEKMAGKLQQPLHTRVDDEIARLRPRTKDIHGAALLETIANAVFSKLNGVLTPDFKPLKRAVVEIQ